MIWAIKIEKEKVPLTYLGSQSNHVGSRIGNESTVCHDGLCRYDDLVHAAHDGVDACVGDQGHVHAGLLQPSGSLVAREEGSSLANDHFELFALLFLVTLEASWAWHDLGGAIFVAVIGSLQERDKEVRVREGENDVFLVDVLTCLSRDLIIDSLDVLLDVTQLFKKFVDKLGSFLPFFLVSLIDLFLRKSHGKGHSACSGVFFYFFHWVSYCGLPLNVWSEGQVLLFSKFVKEARFYLRVILRLLLILQLPRKVEVFKNTVWRPIILNFHMFIGLPNNMLNTLDRILDYKIHLISRTQSFSNLFDQG